MEKPKLSKIAISHDSEERLNQALLKANENFSGGRVTKVELASWLIENACATFDSNAIDEIQRLHFNDASYLNILLRKLRETNRTQLSADEIATLARSGKNPISKPGGVKTKSKTSPDIDPQDDSHK